MSTDLVKNPYSSGALALPDYIKKGDLRGTENIGQEDVKFPALRLAQAGSPQVKRSDAAFIEGLREGELFNSITRENYGEDAVHFLIVNQLGHRHVEFDPQDRNIVLDGNVPDGDPRTEFTFKEENGKQVRVKPLATKFYDYLVILLRDGQDPDVMTLSLKSTQLKKATILNTILKKSKLPSFAHLFKGTPVPEAKGNNSWYGWRFDAAGFPTPELYQLASDTYDGLVGKKVDVAAEAVDDAAKTDDDIPF